MSQRTAGRKYVVDTNCYIDASRSEDAYDALRGFTTWATPYLYLSSVVAAELRAGARTARDRQEIEAGILEPLVRRNRVVTPSAAAWDALGLTIAELRKREGLVVAQLARSFTMDILLAFSCREAGTVVVTNNTRDMVRIQQVFRFDFVPPYPTKP